MRVCQLLCVGLALMLSSCASWHRPELVYRGRNAQHPSTAPQTRTRPLWLEEDEERPQGPQLFDQYAPTLTPPIEGVSHRTGYRGQPERARPARKDRVATNPPGLGFIELPPPPDAP
jgi:hypothetical protein